MIAANVTARLEPAFANNPVDTPTASMGRPSTLQTLVRTHLVQSSSLSAQGVQLADFVIEPDVTRFGLSEFSRTEELAAAGEQATLEVISMIKESLFRLDPQLFASFRD